MKKKLYKLLILSLFIILSTMPLAAHDNEQEKRIEDILALIRQEQSVNEDQAIDPDKVSKDLLEELGDAVMSIRHQDEREHQWMDEMMGGEGSESLRTMHIAMGYRFLQGDDRLWHSISRTWLQRTEISRTGYDEKRMGYAHDV